MSDSNDKVRKYLLIAVLGPGLIGLGVYFLVRELDTSSMLPDMVPESVDHWELPDPAENEVPLIEVLETALVQSQPGHLTGEAPSNEQLSAILHGTLSPSESVAGGSWPKTTLYVMIGKDAFFFEASEQTLHRLTTTLPKEEDEDEDEADEPEKAIPAAWKGWIDPFEEGIKAPVTLIFCSAPSLQAKETLSPDRGRGTVESWSAAAEASLRAELVARSFGLAAVPLLTFQRRALSEFLDLPEGIEALRLLVISRETEVPAKKEKLPPTE